MIEKDWFYQPICSNKVFTFISMILYTYTCISEVFNYWKQKYFTLLISRYFIICNCIILFYFLNNCRVYRTFHWFIYTENIKYFIYTLYCKCLKYWLSLIYNTLYLSVVLVFNN